MCGTPIAFALIITHISNQKRIEVSLDLNETNAISPLKRGEGSKHKDVGIDAAFALGVPPVYCFG